jgi:hypothetical protein
MLRAVEWASGRIRAKTNQAKKEMKMDNQSYFKD